MFLEAQSKQFTLKDDGQIYFQPDSTNPLPGEPLAVIAKGSNLLQPTVALIAGRDTGAEDAEAVRAHVETWLKAHIYTVLEPLFSLVVDETLTGPVKDIALKIFEHTGIVSRGQIETEIAQLDAEMRKTLRAKKVRLGPVLVFLPDLNKPAAVRLRAMLWALQNDVALPAPAPRDGAMSAVVDVTSANPDFYRAIGYPLYGPRVIRIDMLDRVINAVYDAAKEGKFQAEHKMAEWMGCPIADLYAILEAMGHKRIEKAPEAVVAAAPESTEPVAVDDPVVVEEVVAAPVADNAEITATEVVVEPAPKAEQKKPELDWFLLRRGKAHSERAERPERAERKPRVFTPRENAPAADKPKFPEERYAPKKSFGKRDDKEEGKDRSSFKKKKFDDKRDDKRGGGKDKRDHKPSNDARVYSAEASVSDNPFAVLQNLKLK